MCAMWHPIRRFRAINAKPPPSLSRTTAVAWRIDQEQSVTEERNQDAGGHG